MNSPSLQRLTILSFVFHVTLLGAAFWAFNKQSTNFVMSSPYIVSLVGSEVTTQENAAPAMKQAGEQVSTAGEQVSARETNAVLPQKEVKKLTRKEEQQLKERIAALESKKKIEKIVGLRNIISLKGSGTGGKGVASARVKETGEGTAGGSSKLGDYISVVTNKIHEQFEVPKEISKKNLEAVVSIRIRKDGTVQFINFEKRSGNSLFDRSAQKAIIKASPVTQPPYEMEIGVRFYP